ncbi:MAG TPA: hypothetical protein VM261_03790 [Kofleriaceae bacterium]|nr:hypothetical protein [Kofleriaceae bacterium]
MATERQLPILSLLVALVALAWSADARAQNAEAEKAYREGEKLLAAGDIARACEAFELANQLEPGAGTLIRIGECRARNRQFASAWGAYSTAAGRAKSADKRKFAEDAAAALEQRLSYLTIAVSPGADVQGLAITRNGRPLLPAQWNRPAPVDGGTFTITATAPGMEPWSTTAQVADERAQVTIDVPRLTAVTVAEPVNPPTVDPSPVTPLPPVVSTQPAPPTAVSPAARVPVSAETPLAPEAPRSRFTGRRTLGLSLGVGGVAVIGAGVVFGLQARRMHEDAYSMCPQPEVPCNNYESAKALDDRAQSRALLANVALGVGAVGIVTGTVLWITGAPQRSSRTAMAPRIQPGYAGLDLAVRF